MDLDKLFIRGERARDNFEEYLRFVLNITPYKHQERWIEACQKIGDNLLAGHKFMIIAPPGGGKCAAANEKLLLANGREVLYGDLVGEKFEVLVPVDNSRSYKATAYATDNGLESLYEITLESGQVIKRTGHHRLLVRKPRREELKFVEVSKLETTDLIAVINKIGVGQTISKGWLTKEMALVVGMLIGDGHIGKTHISFSVFNDEIKNAFLDATKTINNAVYIHKDGTRIDVLGSIGNRKSYRGAVLSPKSVKIAPVYWALKKLELIGKNSFTKSLPDWTKKLSTPVVAALLQGLLLTDGEITKRDGLISFSSRSENLRDWVAFVSHRLGCPGVKYNRLKANIIQYYWTVFSPFSYKLLTKIGGLPGKKNAEVIKKPKTVGYSSWRFRGFLPKKHRTYSVNHWQHIRKITLLPPEKTVCVSLLNDKHIYCTPVIEHNSTIMSVGLPSWLIGKYPDEHFGVLSYADKVAWDRSIAIRDIIQSSKPYHFTFPDLTPNPQAWDKSNFRVMREAVGDPHPTLRAGGVRSSVISYRLSGLIIDDPLDVKGNDTKAQREKAFHNWQQAIITRLINGAFQLTIGTRMSADDFIGKVLKAEEGEWTIIHTPALNENNKSYWPSNYPVDSLKAKRDKYPDVFAIQYQGDVTGGTTQIIKNIPVKDFDPKECSLSGFGEKNKTEKEKVLAARNGLLIAAGTDSIEENVPVTIRRNGYIEVLSFKELWESIPVDSFFDGEREIKRVENCEVFGKSDFVDVKYISRHYYNGILNKLTSRIGSITLTPNHSLINCDGEKVVPEEMVGKLLPVFKWRRVPHNWRKRKGYWAHKMPPTLFVGTNDLAWVCGFFVAEGWAAKEEKGTDIVEFSNKNILLLERTLKTIKDNLHVKGRLSKVDKHGVSKAIIDDKRVWQYFIRFYDSNREKVITNDILNSSEDIMQEFFNGYMAGDGSLNNGGFPRLTTKSSSLAQQLSIMVNSLFGFIPRFYWRKDKENIKEIDFRKQIHQDSKLNHLDNVEYSGYVYDLTTDTHVFRAGIGNILVSNTAFKDKEVSDYSVCYIGGLDSTGRVWVLDRFKGHYGLPELVDEMKRMWEEWKPYIIWIEDSAMGTPAVQTLKREMPAINSETVFYHGGKFNRAHVLARYFAEGYIVFPEFAPWLDDARHELIHFPWADNDDDVDALFVLVDNLIKQPHPSFYNENRVARMKMD